MTARFYKKEFPDVGDIVIVKIVESTEYGYSVHLLEYDNLEGFVTLAEMSRKYRHRTKRLANIGDIYPMTVIHTEKKKKIVNVSKKFIKPDDVTYENEIFNYKKFIHKIGIEAYYMYNDYLTQHKELNIDLKQVLNNTTWNLTENIKQKEEDNDFFKNLYYSILDDPSIIFTNSEYPEEAITKMVDNFKSRVVSENIQMETMIKVLTLQGVDSLKQILNILQISVDCPPSYKIDIDIASSPIYKLIVKGPNEKTCNEILNSLAKKVKKRVKDNQGIFSIHDPPRVIKKSPKGFKFISEQDLNKLQL